MTSPTPQSVQHKASSPFAVAVASFANMFSVGAVYALGALHAQLPRLLGVSNAARYAPFAAASFGLTVGVVTSSSLIASRGPHSAIARGTALWGVGLIGAGLSIQHLSFELLLFCLSGAGVGVGWTYLAVVIAIGQAFPTLAPARSAIGPVGFASGAAAAFFASDTLHLDMATPADYGRALISAGLTFVTIGGATQLLLPDHVKADSAKKSTWKGSFDAQGFYSVLLFFNALPGMAVFAALPIVLDVWHTDPTPANILPCSMVALGASGPLAPYVSATLGPRLTFVGLICFRGTLLIMLSKLGHPFLCIITLWVVLFGHGTGFGILPTLIKMQSPSSESFTSNYGQVLGAWGVAGIAGSLFNATLLTSPDKVPLACLILGIITLSYGLLLFMLPNLRNKLSVTG